MRHGRALLVGLLTGLVVGCATAPPERPTSWWTRLRSFQGLTGPDVIQMDVAILERPVNDAYINQELWTLADEQPVPLEHKAKLEDNGLRVCQIGGITPAGLQALLTSERSCTHHRRLQLHAGHPTTVTLGPVAPQCRFQVQQEGRAAEITLAQAELTFKVLPTLTADGGVRLQFTPQIYHGEAILTPRPAADRSGFLLQAQRPTEAFPALAWEVTLAPNEYVAVGAHADRAGTLGHQYFVRHDEPVPVQRLLAIRTSRSAPGVEGETGAGTGDEDLTLSRSPPLALQAAWTSARGSMP
jgi:hypothetical protein